MEKGDCFVFEGSLWLAGECVPVPGVRGSTVTHLESQVSNLGKLCQLTDQTQSYFPTRHAAQQHRWLHSQIQLLCSSANASEINVLGGREWKRDNFIQIQPTVGPVCGLLFLR